MRLVCLIVVHPSPHTASETVSRWKEEIRKRLPETAPVRRHDAEENRLLWLHACCQEEVRTRLDGLDPSAASILCTDGSQDVWLSFLAVGVRGFVSFRDQKELPGAIRAVNAGGLYFSRSYHERAGDILYWNHLIHRENHSLPLTPTERRIIQEIAMDRSNREIAQSLRISERTVEHHVSTALRKTGAKSRVGLVIRTLKNFQINVI
ncbi:helix-turn-helix transcriptional regulator [Staphylospora marina]|uniref:helix-turn-helix transcriptional regulator n=1 Tax=Staphylospora marina TaxID=2490858 RepID=UPI000F5BDE31|nr:response regulator transcription factor [Staphylospora marina]